MKKSRLVTNDPRYGKLDQELPRGGSFRLALTIGSIFGAILYVGLFIFIAAML